MRIPENPYTSLRHNNKIPKVKAIDGYCNLRILNLIPNEIENIH